MQLVGGLQRRPGIRPDHHRRLDGGVVPLRQVRLHRRPGVEDQAIEGVRLGGQAETVGDRPDRRLGDESERLHDALAGDRNAFKGRTGARIERTLHLAARRRVGQVSLVEKQHRRGRLGIEPICPQVVGQIGQALEVGLRLRPLRVGDEDDAVSAGEHRPSGGVVLHLAGNGVELQRQPVAAHPAEVDGEEIEKQRAIGGSGEGVQLGAALGVGDAVNMLQRRGLAAERGTVEDDLELDLLVLVVKLDHRSPRAPPGGAAPQ